MRNALFYIAKEEGDDKVLGVAMWLPPKPLHQPPTWTDWLEAWRLWLNQVAMNVWYGRGGLIVKVREERAVPVMVEPSARVSGARLTFGQRYYIWKENQAKAQSEIWTNPKGCYFLNIMVVLPEMQGKGIGKLLMKEVTDMADKEGIPCYLESSRDVPNMQIYGRMGFKFAKQMDCDDDGVVCKLFCMVREPQGASSNVA